MPTINIINRTFQIRYNGATGTAFTIDVEGKQYFITAKHVVEGIGETSTIEILDYRGWMPFSVTSIYLKRNDIDVIVLAPSIKLSQFPLNPASDGVWIGADVYFLGFPYGLSTDVYTLNKGFPVALVKKATVSASGPKAEYWLLDGHNNPGFSGGPVVFSHSGNNQNLQVIAVVSGYRYASEPILSQDQTESSYRYLANTGIVIAWDIRFAVEAINQNPIGFPINSQ